MNGNATATAGTVTLAAVRGILASAGFAEARLQADTVTVVKPGFRAYQHEDAVQLGYWPAEGETGALGRLRDMASAYTNALEAAGCQVERRASVGITVTGRKAA